MNTSTAQIIAEVATAAATQTIDYELNDVTVMWDYTPTATPEGPGSRKTVLQVEFAEHLVVLVRMEHATGLVEWTRPGSDARYPEPKQHLRQALATEGN